MFCAGYAAVRGIERADILASPLSTPDLSTASRAEVLGGLRNLVNKERAEHESPEDRRNGERR